MPKVLIIDDEAGITDLIGQFLDGAGFSVDVATSGQNGLQKAFSAPPDVAVVDIMMPGMDGYEVCQRLRNHPRTTNTAILVLTARGQLIDQEMALRVGADAYMTKPFKGKGLVEEIQQLLADRPPAMPALGYQILVLHLHPGAGTTTLAANLALSLAKGNRHLTVLADMVLQGGQVQERLGLPASPSWLASPAGAADALAAHLVRHESGLFALPAPAMEEAVQPEPAAVAELLQTLRAWHDFVVVDTPVNMGPLAPVLFRSSPLVLLLLTPEPKVLQAAQASLATIKKLGGDGLRLWPVMNMLRPDQQPLRQQAEEIWGLQIAATLPWAPEECTQALMSHQPAVLSRPQSPLAMAIQTLARRIVESLNGQPQGGIGA